MNKSNLFVFVTLIIWSAVVGFRPVPVVAQQSAAASESPTIDESTTQRKLSQFLKVAEEVRELANVPGVGIGIVYQNEVLFSGGLGMANVAEQVPVSEDTLFAIGSNTKAFTGFLITKLASAGKLSWDQPVAELIPDFELSDPYVARHMTLADACSHMTGLTRRDQFWKGHPIDRQQVYIQATRLSFDFSLRQSFSYNNHMYVVAGKAIECVTGESWESNVRKTIFEPLSMTDSYLTYDEFMSHPQRSIGYGQDGTTPLPHVNVDNVGPAGSITSTPRDFVKWLRMWVNKGETARHPMMTADEYRDYSVPRSATMVSPREFKSYWAGWGEKFIDGQVQFLHSGGIDGQNSIIVARPTDGFGIFVLQNQSSDYKNLMVEYAEQIFLESKLNRNSDIEQQLAAIASFGSFQQTLLDKGIEAATKVYETLEANELETPMNELGYQLLGSRDFAKALFVFQLNTTSHPASSNVWDSLGECYLMMKDYPAARTHYQKSLKLDSTNANATEMLKRIEKLLQDEQDQEERE